MLLAGFIGDIKNPRAIFTDYKVVAFQDITHNLGRKVDVAAIAHVTINKNNSVRYTNFHQSKI